MKTETGIFCPLIKDDCMKFKCNFFTKLVGAHPQTGVTVDEWDCAIKWLPLLLVEGAKESRHTSAAINSFRNEMVRGQQNVLGMVENGEVKKLDGRGP